MHNKNLLLSGIHCTDTGSIFKHLIKHFFNNNKRIHKIFYVYSSFSHTHLFPFAPGHLVTFFSVSGMYSYVFVLKCAVKIRLTRWVSHTHPPLYKSNFEYTKIYRMNGSDILKLCTNSRSTYDDRSRSAGVFLFLGISGTYLFHWLSWNKSHPILPFARERCLLPVNWLETHLVVFTYINVNEITITFNCSKNCNFGIYGYFISGLTSWSK